MAMLKTERKGNDATTELGSSSGNASRIRLAGLVEAIKKWGQGVCSLSPFPFGYLSTTTVSMTRLPSPVLMMLCSEPFLQMWHVPARKSSSFPSHIALLVLDRM